MSLRCLLLMALLAMLQGCGAPMIRTSCDKPRITNFSGPSSYVVMLPYRYGGDSEANRESAQQFNQIARLQALQGAVDMPSTQITFVEGDPNDPQCDIERIYDRVVENRSSFFWHRPYHSAIFIWGELFDRDDGLIVQSHLRVFWNGSDDREISVNVNAPRQTQSWRFTGDLPTDTVSFPAHKISRDTQAQMAAAITSGLTVRAAPRLDAAPESLPKKFSVMSWKRPWLELQRRDLSSVWLLVDEAGLGAVPPLPESLFAQAVASYLNYRVGGQPQAQQRAREALTQFRAALGRSHEAAARVPLALANVIDGTLNLQRPTAPSADVGAPGPAASMQSQASLTDASRQMPASGAVLNLAALSRLPACCEGADAAARVGEIHHMLTRAQALEPGNLKICANVLHWYQYLATLPADLALPFPRAELAERTEQARAMLSDWSAFSGR